MWLILLFLIEVEAMLGKVEVAAVVCRVREKHLIDDGLSAEGKEPCSPSLPVTTSVMLSNFGRKQFAALETCALRELGLL
jgi:hypothetical protein